MFNYSDYWVPISPVRIEISNFNYDPIMGTVNYQFQNIRPSPSEGAVQGSLMAESPAMPTLLMHPLKDESAKKIIWGFSL